MKLLRQGHAGEAVGEKLDPGGTEERLTGEQEGRGREASGASGQKGSWIKDGSNTLTTWVTVDA